MRWFSLEGALPCRWSELRGSPARGDSLSNSPSCVHPLSHGGGRSEDSHSVTTTLESPAEFSRCHNTTQAVDPAQLLQAV